MRGDFYKESDVDLIVLGRGPEYRLERHGGHLFSISWRTLSQLRGVFDDPAEAAGAILGWRGAVILLDPKRIARSWRTEAQRWTWDRVVRKCDRWVAEQITGYAEDVQKLWGAMRQRRNTVAAAYRGILATRLSEIMAVHRRILYDGDYELFAKVSKAMGPSWRRAQTTAFGTRPGTFRQSCQAAMKLYAIAAAEVRDLLDDRQYAVVAHACQVAGHPLPNRK